MWTPSKEEYDFIVMLYQELFQNEKLYECWWPVLHSCSEITSNIELLSELLSALPTDHPFGYSALLCDLINCIETIDGLQNVEQYAPLISRVVLPILTKPNFKPSLQKFCGLLASSGNASIIGKILGDITEGQGTEKFQILCDANAT